MNLVAQLTGEERRRGAICASTGNHGQSLAIACRLHGVRCRIVVPAGNNPDKNAAMRAFGADVVEHGRDFDEAREYVEALRPREGWRYVHNANEPHLIAGVGDLRARSVRRVPGVDYIFMPIGGGSGAAGCAIVEGGSARERQIIGVQAARADAFARSWRGQVACDGRADTFAEGSPRERPST